MARFAREMSFANRFTLPLSFTRHTQEVYQLSFLFILTLLLKDTWGGQWAHTRIAVFFSASLQKYANFLLSNKQRVIITVHMTVPKWHNHEGNYPVLRHTNATQSRMQIKYRTTSSKKLFGVYVEVGFRSLDSVQYCIFTLCRSYS